MIKALAYRNGEPSVFFGLSKGNVKLLMEGKPIFVNLADLGLSGEVVIHYGDTEADIMQDLKQVGLLPEEGGEMKN